MPKKDKTSAISSHDIKPTQKLPTEEDFKPDDPQVMKKIHKAIENILGRNKMVFFIATEAGDVDKEENIDWWFFTQQYPGKLYKDAAKRFNNRCEWAEKREK